MDAGAWIAVAGLFFTQLGTVIGVAVRAARAETRVAATLEKHAEMFARGERRFERLDQRMEAFVAASQTQQVELAKITTRLDALLRERAENRS